MHENNSFSVSDGNKHFLRWFIMLLCALIALAWNYNNIICFLDVDLLCEARYAYPKIILSCTPTIPGSTNVDFTTCSIDGSSPKQCELSYSMLELICFIVLDNCSESCAMVGWSGVKVEQHYVCMHFQIKYNPLFPNEKCYSSLFVFFIRFLVQHHY